MKRLPIFFAVLLPCLALAIAPGNEGKVNDFLKAKSLKLGYTIKGQKKYLTISDDTKVKAVLATISIGETDDTSLGRRPKGTVDFILADDSAINIFFVGPRQLDRADRGQIYLKDTKFYDKINEVVSEKEGRKIDVLENNE